MSGVDLGRDQILAVTVLVERPQDGQPVHGARVPYDVAAQQYAAVNIPAIPLGGDDGKKPLVNGPEKFGVRGSLKIAPRFSQANVGFWCGQRSGVTVVDIDDPSGRDLRWALEEFGPSPIVVRTGSGKHHIWYRHSGEQRRIRPFRGREIDILGSGPVVAPPSIRPGGAAYEFILGSLADVPRLPPMRQVAEVTINAPEPDAHAAIAPSPGAVVAGRRNEALFDYARSIAGDLGKKEELVDRLLKFNASNCSPPLEAQEVCRVAGSVWQYKVKGELWLPGTHRVALDGDAVAALLRAGNTDALALLALLKRAHPIQADTFAICPAAMERARCIGSWSKRRYRAAVRDLCHYGVIERITEGGHGVGDTAQYRFPEGSANQRRGAI
jgi:hypothetical protein